MYEQPGIGSPHPRQLVRSSHDRLWAGVAGGLAEYFDIDATLTRIVWVAVTILTGGLAIPAYLLLWVLIPRDDRLDPFGHRSPWSSSAAPRPAESVAGSGVTTADDELGATAAATRKGAGEPSLFTAPPPGWEAEQPRFTGEHPARRQRSTGLILVVLGCLFLAGNMGLFRWVDWHTMWPLMLVLVGVAMLVGQGRHWRR